MGCYVTDSLQEARNGANSAAAKSGNIAPPDTASTSENQDISATDTGKENGTQMDSPGTEKKPQGVSDSLTFTLPYPISANRYWRHGRLANGVQKVMLSKEARNYRLLCQGAYLEQFKKILNPFTGTVAVAVTLTPPDKRRRDIDNPIKPLLDVLQKSLSILNDDSQVKALHVIMNPPGGTPGAIVTIAELPEWGS